MHLNATGLSVLVLEGAEQEEAEVAATKGLRHATGTPTSTVMSPESVWTSSLASSPLGASLSTSPVSVRSSAATPVPGGNRTATEPESDRAS